MEMPDKLWFPAPENLALSKDDVHIWRAELDQPEWLQAQLAATLSADEQTRAKRFHFDQHRQRFIVARGILRTILGQYLGKKPQQLEFCYSDRGKPALASTSADGSVCFNLSHSQGMALYAIARDRQVGIDLEFIRTLDDADRIAKRFFSPQEYALLEELPPNQKQKAFFDLWTCKEAYLKATGEGLAGLHQVEVMLTPGEPPRLLFIGDTPPLATCWFLHQLIPTPDYAAAVAVEGHQCQLSCWHWSASRGGEKPGF